jgi:hypothetical protein
MSKTELTFQGATFYIFAALIVNMQVFSLFSAVPFYTIISASVF